jgi:hypothetical protein
VEFTVFWGGPGRFFAFPKPLFFGYLLYFWRFLPRGFYKLSAVFPFLGDLQSAPSYFWAIVFAWVRVLIRSLIIRFGFWHLGVSATVDLASIFGLAFFG